MVSRAEEKWRLANGLGGVQFRPFIVPPYQGMMFLTVNATEQLYVSTFEW